MKPPRAWPRAWNINTPPVYHPLHEEDRATTENILPNHTDHGATTFLRSQPVSCLQILGKDQKWRWVPYRKGALVCNLGDVMEILSGGILKATRHRAPVDQQDYERVSVCSFNHADQDLILEPLHDAPLIKQVGLQRDSEVYGGFCSATERGEEIPKFGEWKTLRNKNAQEPTSKLVEIDGVPHREHIVGGIKVYRQV
ncbi:Clavaminate synthase-like protein [Thozetella sp. PMI_491]|nr:Clavaminate synthase-like protein [Thozetella sp. PMI_491]